METLCPPPRLAVPASPRGSPCSPTTRKPRRGTPEFSPLCLRALAFCALAKPRPSALGLGPGELAPRTPVLLGPRASPCTGGPVADCLKHLGGPSDVTSPAREDADVAVCLGGGEEEEGGGGFPHSGAGSCAPTGRCPVPQSPRESPTSSAWSPPKPSRDLESQPDAASSQPLEPSSQPPPPPAGLSPEPATLEQPVLGSEAAEGEDPALAAPEAPALSPSTADAAPDAPSDLRQEHFNRLIRRSKLWCYAKGFALDTPSLRRGPERSAAKARGAAKKRRRPAPPPAQHATPPAHPDAAHF